MNAMLVTGSLASWSRKDSEAGVAPARGLPARPLLDAMARSRDTSERSEAVSLPAARATASKSKLAEALTVKLAPPKLTSMAETDNGRREAFTAP